MSIQRFFVKHGQIETISFLGEVEDRFNDNLDIFVSLRNGKTYSFTVFTVSNLVKLMNQNEEKSFVCPDFLIVRELSLDCILDGISTCLELGIERFGILQKDAHQS